MTSPQRTFVRACALADVPENGVLGVGTLDQDCGASCADCASFPCRSSPR